VFHVSVVAVDLNVDVSTFFAATAIHGYTRSSPRARPSHPDPVLTTYDWPINTLAWQTE
jgi:hypothetical protein